MAHLSPEAAIAEVERVGALPGGAEERLRGWGVMGLTFSTGHVLGLRRFPWSSFGPGYTSVWYRTPEGAWTFWSTEAPDVSCNRYAGAAIDHTARTPIALSWPGPYRLVVEAPEQRFRWEVELVDTFASKAMSWLAARLPGRVLRSRRVLSALGPAGGRLLGAGPLGMTGHMPNGQVFALVPEQLWMVSRSTAALGWVVLDTPRRLREQARIGDFRIPQRGVLAVGTLYLDALDPAVHDVCLTAAAATSS